MKKNYFRLLLAIAMMLMTGVSFTSCDDVLDVVDNPAAPSTEPEGKTEEADIEQTAQGAKVTINNLSAIAAFSDEIKEEIVEFQKKNPGKEFVLDIVASEPLEITDAENTILIPALSEFNIVINVNSNIVANGKQLTLKLDQKAGTRGEENPVIKGNFDNKIALNLKNDDLDLILDVPGTTVTLNKLNSIQILNGVSVVKDGGSINTYIWAPTSNDYEMNNGEPEWVKHSWTVDDKPFEEYIPNVRNQTIANGLAYIFKNLKIVKGKADYAKVNVWEEKYKLDKLTIAEGATVLLNYRSYIKEIVGEGKGAIVKSNEVWWHDESEKTFATDITLDGVDKISNISIEPFIDGDFKEGKLISSGIYDVPSNIENVTFKMGYITFRNPNVASTAVKNCKFESDVTDRIVSIAIPGQTEAINAFKFNFENCEFNENVSFNTYITTSKPKVDKEGKPVLEDRYEWVVFNDDNWDWYSSDNEADIPEANKAVGLLDNYNDEWNEEKERWEPQKGYWKTKRTVWEEITFKDFYATVSFKECKYAGETMTAKNFHLQDANIPKGAYLRFEFDGKTYRALWDTENQTYALIEA